MDVELKYKYTVFLPSHDQFCNHETVLRNGNLSHLYGISTIHLT